MVHFQFRGFPSFWIPFARFWLWVCLSRRNSGNIFYHFKHHYRDGCMWRLLILPLRLKISRHFPFSFNVFLKLSNVYFSNIRSCQTFQIPLFEYSLNLSPSIVFTNLQKERKYTVFPGNTTSSLDELTNQDIINNQLVYCSCYEILTVTIRYVKALKSEGIFKQDRTVVISTQLHF